MRPIREPDFARLECCFARRYSDRIDFDTFVPSFVQSEVRHGARPYIGVPAAYFD